jgi:hypothetical protein
MKIYRGYLKNTGFSDLKMDIQRQQILKKLEKKNWVEEKLTHRISMESEGEVCSDHNFDFITMMGKLNREIPVSTIKNGIPDPRKPRILLYWYIDTVNRDGYEELIYDLSPEETVLTMDFTLPQEILDDSRFHLIKGKRSQISSLFNLIRDQVRQKCSLRKIASQIKSRLGIDMSHEMVRKIINQNKSSFVNAKSGLFV